MPLLVDFARRTISAGVGDLVGEAEGRTMGLGGSGLARMWIGQELHRRVQDDLAAAEPGFAAEVAVSGTLEVDGWTLELAGRADGVLYDGGRALRVDEIKTLHFAVELNTLFAEERLERFQRQVRIYAWLLGAGEEGPAARLVLVDIVSGDERHEQVEWTARGVESWLRHQVHRLVAAEARRQTRLDQLRAAAAGLPFPHPAPRPVQEAIGEAVRTALGQGRNLLLSAPTGCGKTAAVLHPALQAAMAGGHRLFFLTAKTLQQRLAVSTLAAMQGDSFRSLQLRAKAKMCAHTEVICHEEVCPYARDYAAKLKRSNLLPTLLAARRHQDPDEIFAAARDHELCPFELSLDLLPDTDVVVCDYNYVFDPALGLGALLHGNALQDAVLVVDEAHNLVERSREYYSPALATPLLTRAATFLESRDNAVFARLHDLVDELIELVQTTVEATLEQPGPGSAPTTLRAADLRDLRIELDGAMLEYFLYKRENSLWLAADPVVDVFFAVIRLHRVLSLGGDEFVHLASRTADGGEEVKILCLDAARFLGEVVERSAGVVAMSATLEPFDFYRNLLGFSSELTDECSLPSPFPPANRLILTVSDVDTSFRSRGIHYDAIAAWVARVAHPRHNVLTLFPSYSFLASVRDRLPAVSHRVLVQEAGLSDHQQGEVLAALGSGQPHLVLAVLGGVFAEGVDYPGSMLSQVIVVSPGLPQYNLERELLKDYYQERYGHSFAYAYLIPGMTRVVQAAGRLIRSEHDRGVIVLMCRRFAESRYGRLLPADWTGGDPATLVDPDPAARVAAFFAADP